MRLLLLLLQMRVRRRSSMRDGRWLRLVVLLLRRRLEV